MSIFTFYLEGNTGIGRVTQLQSRNQGQIICVMDQSFTHRQPRLPSHVHMSCSCLYFSPGRVQGLSPVSFAKTLPSRPYTSWLLLSLFRHLFIHMDWNPVCWKQTWLLSWPAWGFHPLPQSLSSWAARLSIYSSSGCFSQPGWVRGHTSDAGDHWNLSWGKRQKYRRKDRRPLQGRALSATNTHPPELPARFHSAPTQV